MSISTNLVRYLNSVAAITALVDDRICQAPMHEKEKLPYVVFMRSGRPSELDLNGVEVVGQTLFDIECRGRNQGEAEAVSDAVRDALQGHRGTWGVIRIQGVFVTDQDDDYIPIPPGNPESEVSVLSRVEVISG